MEPSRYLGSDDGIRRMGEAQELVTKVTASSVDRLANSTNAFLDNLMKGNAQLAQAQITVETAKAKAAAERSGGIQGFTKTVVDGLVEYKQGEDRKQAAAAKAAQDKLEFDYKVEQDKIKREDEISKRQADAFYQTGAVEASQALNDLQLRYTRENWNNGVSNFKSEAAKLLAQYPLRPEALASLTETINKFALGRQESVRQELDTNEQKLLNAKADSEGFKLLGGLKPTIASIRNMLPTEQSAPVLNEISTKLERFMLENNGLTTLQKVEQVNKILPEIYGAFGDKADAYEKYGANLRALRTWNEGYSKAYAQFMATGNMAEFENAKNILYATTGKDFSERMVQPLEQEKFAVEVQSLVSQKDRLADEAAKRAGLNFQFSNGFTQWLVSAFTLNPQMMAQVLSNPQLKDRDDVKQAVQFTNQLQQAREGFARLGVERAATNEDLKRLDLTNVNYFASVTKDIATSSSQGRTLTLQQQLLVPVIQQFANNPNIDPAAANAMSALMAGQQASSTDIAALQRSLRDQTAAINASKAAALESYNAKVLAEQSKHTAIMNLFGGKFPSDEELKKYYQGGAAQFQSELENYKGVLQGAQQQVTQPFGQQSNFVDAPGTGLAVSPGSYRVAPKSKVFVQTKVFDGGTPFITPIAAGTSAGHTFSLGTQYKAPRPGGRKHAGIDFPLQRGQRAVTVVSGEVVWTGTAGNYGGVVDVRGDNGYVYRYTHIKPFVKKGQRLEPGEAVGTPNMSGTNIGGAHLHFEVHPAAEYAKNPWDGIIGTVEPISHLRQLTSQAGQTIGSGANQRVSGQSVFSVQSQSPFSKTDNRTVVASGGVGVFGGVAQLPGGIPLPANTAFSAQRPMQTTGGVGYTIADSPRINSGDLGYAWLRNNPSLMNQLHQTAARLQVPSTWIADIMAQESGNGRLARRIHPGAKNRNYGLFGFGKDSGVPNWTSLDEVQQVIAYENYMIRNGWLKHKQRVGDSANIAQFWAITRMGTGWRREILNGRQPQTLRLNDSGKTFADEIRLLGNHVGREYSVPDGSRSSRSKRNSAPRSNSNNKRRWRSDALGDALADSGTENVYYRG